MSLRTPADGRRHVVIAGAGVAGLEALMALHDLGERRMRVTLIAPEPAFRLRSTLTWSTFASERGRAVPIDDICRRFGAELRRTTLASVDPEHHRVRCADGHVLGYDALIVAAGARRIPAYPPALTISDADAPPLPALLADLVQGWCSSLAVVVPPGESWTLPAYELALVVAHDGRAAGRDVEVHLVTPEPNALAVFGPGPGQAVAELLRDAGVQLHLDAFADVTAGHRLVLMPGANTLDVERVVALPRLAGPGFPGLPCDIHGFLPTDEHGRVRGVADVYAAGDVTDFPVKQGGLAAQQADAAVLQIVAAAGLPVEPEPFRPVLRGLLVTGTAPRFLRSDLAGGGGEPRIADRRLWWPPVKVVGRYFSRWLASELGIVPAAPDMPHTEVEVPLRHERATDRA